MTTFWVMMFVQFAGFVADGHGNINLHQPVQKTFVTYEACEKALIPTALNHQRIKFSVQKYGGTQVRAVENNVNNGPLSTYTVLKCVEVHQ